MTKYLSLLPADFASVGSFNCMSSNRYNSRKRTPTIEVWSLRIYDRQERWGYGCTLEEINGERSAFGFYGYYTSDEAVKGSFDMYNPQAVLNNLNSYAKKDGFWKEFTWEDLPECLQYPIAEQKPKQLQPNADHLLRIFSRFECDLPEQKKYSSVDISLLTKGIAKS